MLISLQAYQAFTAYIFSLDVISSIKSHQCVCSSANGDCFHKSWN